jgi:hypothetical protein
MKLTNWLLALVLMAPELMAADTGLYDISDASHPKLLKEQIKQTTIASQSNDNRHYALAFRADNSFSLPCTQIGLIVGKQTIRFNSQGMDNQGRFTSMETTVDDPDVIPQIAQQFHAQVLKRRHPGQQMLVQFIPDKAEFKVGEPVTVKLRITNVGTREFTFFEGGRQRGARDNQFAFSAELVGSKMVAETGDPMNFGGMEMSVTVKPGESHEIGVDLTRWFVFKEAETYNLRGSYHMDFVNSKTDEYYTIWEDYACAEFTLKIKR